MAKQIQVSTIIDFAHGRMTSSESLELLESIEKDPHASKELDLVVDLMNEASDPQSEVFRAPTSDQRSVLLGVFRSSIDTIRNHPFLYPAGAFGSMVAALAIVISVNVLSTNRFDELTGIERTAFTWNARGIDNSDIAGAYTCFTNGQYDKSLTLLDRYIHLEPRGDLAPYVHYAAGAVGLISSRENFLSIFQTRDVARISDALNHLALAISQTSNRRLLEESRFLRAKGYLMLDRPVDAISELDSLRSLNGPRCEEAMQMIERIHALTR